MPPVRQTGPERRHLLSRAEGNASKRTSALARAPTVLLAAWAASHLLPVQQELGALAALAGFVSYYSFSASPGAPWTVVAL